MLLKSKDSVEVVVELPALPSFNSLSVMEADASSIEIVGACGNESITREPTAGFDPSYT